MKTSYARLLVWGLIGAVALAYIGMFAFGWLVRGTDHPAATFDPTIVMMGAFPLVGALVALRRPRNAIGWILLAIGVAWSLFGLSQVYAVYGLFTDPGAVPRPDLALALGAWLWVPAVGLMATFLLLLFPDGHLSSPRWRWVARLSALCLVVLSVISLVWPGESIDQNFPGVQNPLGLEFLAPAIESVEAVGIVLFLACIAASALSVVQRFRRSRGQDRLRLKWLATAASAVAFLYVALMVGGGIKEFSGRTVVPQWLETLAVVSFALIPVSIGIAILRHRLYDIDRIINRALVYGALTALLAAIYTVSVTAASSFIPGSALVTAGATLAVAALFQPLRRRVQGFIDRRFYRQKYDAVRTVEAFSARLRDEVDLGAMRAQLMGAVQQTVQPRAMSIWLKR